MYNYISDTDKRILELIHRIRVERKNSNNRMTAYPIYLVQSRGERTIDTDYDQCDVERLYILDLAEDGYYPTIKEIKEKKALRETSLPCNVVMEIEEEAKELDDVIKILEDNNLNDEYGGFILYHEYYWETKAYFFSEKEAEEYRIYQKHNLGESRVFVDYVGYSNCGSMMELLKLIDDKE